MKSICCTMKEALSLSHWWPGQSIDICYLSMCISVFLLKLEKSSVLKHFTQHSNNTLSYDFHLYKKNMETHQ